MAKTHKGRVVYDRKPHVFTLSDVTRILRKLEPASVGLWVGPDVIRKIKEIFAPKLFSSLGARPSSPDVANSMAPLAVSVGGDPLTDPDLPRKLRDAKILLIIEV